jgi:RND superfamily putative drug exporter
MGLLIDTFIVRSLLVPSIAVLAGSASWWPSARARRP